MTRKNDNGCPENIKPGWLGLAAALQLALHRDGGKGFAKVTISLVAYDKDVRGWLPPKIERISPLTLTEVEMQVANPEAAIVLAGLMEMK